MKKHLIVITALFFSISMLNAQEANVKGYSQVASLSNFFKRYADDERVSYAKIGKNLQTVTVEVNSSNRSFAQSLEKEIIDILSKEKFELQVESRDKGERSFIYSLFRDDKTNETVIINTDKSELNILWTSTKGIRQRLWALDLDMDSLRMFNKNQLFYDRKTLDEYFKKYNLSAFSDTLKMFNKNQLFYDKKKLDEYFKKYNLSAFSDTLKMFNKNQLFYDKKKLDEYFKKYNLSSSKSFKKMAEEFKELGKNFNNMNFKKYGEFVPLNNLNQLELLKDSDFIIKENFKNRKKHKIPR